MLLGPLCLHLQADGLGDLRHQAVVDAAPRRFLPGGGAGERLPQGFPQHL